MRRASDANGRRMQKLEFNAFKDVTLEAIAKHRLLNPGSQFKPDQVFQNNHYVVQVFSNIKRNGRVFDKIMIRRSDAKPIYSWADLFRLKNELFGEEIEAVQFFPKKSELIDQANLYWLWIEKEVKV